MKNEKWINVAKCMAILAVLFDHTYGILYYNIDYVYATWFSVTVFIFLMGITTYFSFDYSSVSLKEKILLHFRKILPAYILAVFLYEVVSAERFDLLNFLKHIINFDASAPLYYIALYLQLELITPLLFYFLRKSKEKKYVFFTILIGGVITFFIGIVTTEKTNLLGIILGGGKLFGGTYIFVLYIGMVIGAFYEKITRIGKNLAGNISGLIFTLFMSAYIFYTCIKSEVFLRAEFPIGQGVNPPSVIFILYGFFVMAAIFFIVYLTERNPFFSRINSFLSFIGKHTLYIFLYHRLFLDYPLPSMELSVWSRRVIYLAVMIAAPILMEYIAKYIGKYVKKCYHYVRSDQVG